MPVLIKFSNVSIFPASAPSPMTILSRWSEMCEYLEFLMVFFSIFLCFSCKVFLFYKKSFIFFQQQEQELDSTKVKYNEHVFLMISIQQSLFICISMFGIV